MGFVKARGRFVRIPLCLSCLSLSVYILGVMQHATANPVAAGLSAAATDSAPKNTRHFDVSSGSIANAFATVVSGSHRPSDEDDRLEAKRRLRDGAEGTYIGEILAERDSALARWPDRPSKPLSVWIQRRSRITDFSLSYADRVRDAFTQWDRLGLPMRFSFVDDSTRAEVHVTWIDHFDQPISGRTRWGRDDNWAITDANIVLAMHHHQGELLDEESMRAMAMHEIGHLLGLDHTTDSTSIMASKVRVRELSGADRATVRLLYSVPPGPFR
jgi:hypothetical protein